MGESDNHQAESNATSENSKALAPTEQSYTDAAVLATETIIPLAQNLETTAVSMKVVARESHEQTRHIQSVSATLKFIAFGMALMTLAVLVGVIYLLRDVLALVVVAFLIAYILGPIVDMVERRGVNRTLVVIIVTLIIIGSLVALSTVTVNSIVGQVVKISEDVQDPEIRERISHNVAEWLNRCPEFIRTQLLAYFERREVTERALEELTSASPTDVAIENNGVIELTIPEAEAPPTQIEDEWVMRLVTLVQTKISGYIIKESQQILSAISSSAKGALSAFTTSIIIVFLTFFILNGGPQIKKAFIQMVPNRFFEATLILIDGLDKQLGDYLRSRLLETAALSLLFSIGYWILGLRFVVLLGIVAGLANLIPYIGPFIGAIPALIVVFLGSHFGIGWSLLAVLALTLGGQLVDNAIIFPLVVGKSVELGPVTTVVVVLLGEQLLGLVGLLIAVPIAAMIKLICQEVYTEFKGYTRSIVHGH